MVFFVFVVGVLAGIAATALLWVGASSAFVIAGFGILLFLCAFLSSAVTAVVANGPQTDDEDA